MRERIVSWLRSTGESEVPAVGSGGGDYRLNPTAPAHAAYTRAAVLVPLIDRPEGMTVLLTLRTEHLHDHAGQVSFPGGRAEQGDHDAIDTALRETEEEIGLQRRYVEVLGFLDRYRTVTGFDIEPVVGIVTPGFALRLDAFEVAEVFEVSLDTLLREESFERKLRVHQGRERHFYEVPHARYRIWGATAGILHNLCLRAQGRV